MARYLITVFDISDIEKKKKLEEFSIEADGKVDAQDKAHTIADKKYPNKQRMISIREM